MAGIESSELLSAMLLVKAVLAVLAVLLFAYYKIHWDRAKRHLPLHFFYAKWRAVRHAVALGIAAIGFAAGFLLELFGAAVGLSPAKASFFSSLFEIGSLFAMLYVFFELTIEDVPHLVHLAETARHRRHYAQGHEEKTRLRIAVRRGRARKRKR
ncbi:MAG: hypothetical protein N3E51_04630 [Candidatus Micrarchaeota archaeon]|nr:hypothetical protein [Candidatus Micrarchaeota archaeon]